MPVQVTPFKGSSLAEIALRGTQLNQNQQRLDIAEQQGQTRINQANQRIALTEQQIDQAAQRMNLSREQFLQKSLLEAIDMSGNHDELVARLGAAGLVQTPEHEQNLRKLPASIFERQRSARDTEQAKLDNERNKTTNANERLEIDRERLALDREKFENPAISVSDQIKLKTQETTEGRKAEGKQELQNIANGLLQSDTFRSVFGSIQGRLPSLFQETADAEADIDRLVALLSLDAREALKGTGQISDFESKVLGQAATILGNKSISDTKAKAALEDIAGIIGGVGEREVTRGEQVGRFTVRRKN